MQLDGLARDVDPNKTMQVIIGMCEHFYNASDALFIRINPNDWFIIWRVKAQLAN